MYFSKIEACGNDFCIFGSPISTFSPTAEYIRKICDRHFGIGCDCAVCISRSENADYFMHVYNPDGFEAEICGNALRCSAQYVYECGYFNKKVLTAETLAGVRSIQRKDNMYKVCLGKPQVCEKGILNVSGATIPYFLIDTGNPHCVVFVEHISDDEFYRYGNELSCNPHFKNGTNVEFARIIGCGEIEIRVWERGIGETLSCSTGSCAAYVAANEISEMSNECAIRQKGGTIKAEIDSHGRIYISGGCNTIFKGKFLP